MSTLAQAYVQIIPSTKGITGSISKALGGESASAGKSSGESIAANLVSSLKGVLAAAGIGTIIKETLDAGGALQQSFGGIDTVYAKAEESMKSMARQAAVAGISANTYAEQAVKFGEALKRSFNGDTSKAAEAANQAILDMADNSAKLGNDLGLVQNAYSGLAKNNYTMLDNLALGYQGTRTEMQRLLDDANKYNAEQGKITNYQIDNFGDMAEAIHVVQERLGIAGVAADEASTTFTGSFGAMSASVQNLMADLALGNTEWLTTDLNSLSTSVSAFLTNNLLPMIGNILKGIPIIVQTLFTTMLPQMVTQATNMLTTLSATLTTMLPTAVNTLTTNILPTITSMGVNLINNLASGLATGVPALLAQVMPMLLQISESLRTNAGLLVDAGINLILQLGQGIANSLPTLIASIPQIVINIAGIINDNAPKLLMAGVKLLVTLGQGIINAWPTLKENFGAIIEALIAVWSAINWMQLGLNLITFIKNGVSSLSTTIPEALKDIGNKAVELFKAIDWKGVGTAVIDFIKGGITSLATVIPSTLKAIGESAVSVFKSINWLQLGKDIINGIVEGVKAMAGALIDAITDIAEDAFDAVTDFFDIGSPSKLMANEVGRWIPAGIAVGIEDNIDPLTAAMDEVNAAAGIGYAGAIASQPSYSASVETGSGGMNEVISLLERYLPNIGSDIYMDGAKVGKVVNKQLGMAL